MKTPIILITALALLVACNNDSKDSVEKADSANKAKLDSNTITSGKEAVTATKSESDFLVKAMEGGMMEVSLGSIAKQKGQNKRVQDFGNMMINDHGVAGDQIKTLALARNVTLPTMTGDDKSKMIRDLNEKKDDDFDKEYVNLMVKDHKDDIKEFEEASDKIQDPEIRQFIMATLPVLRKHLDSCTAIQKALDKKH